MRDLESERVILDAPSGGNLSIRRRDDPFRPRQRTGVRLHLELAESRGKRFDAKQEAG